MQVLSDDHRLTHVFHVADLHVSTDSERVPEYAQVFDSLLGELSGHRAVRDRTALLVIAGDVLHNKCKASTDGARLLFDFVNRCLCEFPVLVICGNHDFRQDEPGITDAIEMLVAPYASQTTPFPIHYLRQTGLYRWANVGFGVVSVKDTLRQRNTSGIVSVLPDYPSPRAFDQGVECRVALFHGTVCRSFLPGDRRGIALESSYPITWFEGYDVGMFGDNHTQQVSVEEDARPPLAWGYPGSLVQQTFGESLTGHGYIEWDVGTKRGSARHVPNDRGRVTMTMSDGAWWVSTGSSPPAPLPEAVSSGLVPRAAVVRAAGNRLDAEEALKREGVPRATVVPFAGGGVARGSSEDRRGAGTGQSASGVEDINNPDAWTRFLEESGYHVDGETRDLLAGRGLQVPRRLGDALGIDLSACNSDICKLADEFSSTAAPVRKRNVRLLRLEWSWLLCFGPGNCFDFRTTDGSVALLNGPNASGKSSFLDVLCLAMFGEPSSSRSGDSDDVVCNVRPPDARAFASLRVEVDGNEYQIHRGFSTRAGGSARKAKTAVVRRVLPEGNSEVEAEGSVKVREFVSRVLGTADGVSSSSIVQQMDSASFFHQKPSHRRETVEAALNVDTVNRYEALLKKSVSAHSRALASCEAMLREAASFSDEGCDVGEDELVRMRQHLGRVNARMAEVSSEQSTAMRGVDFEAAETWAAMDTRADVGDAVAELSANLAMQDFAPPDLAAVPSRRADLREELEELGGAAPPEEEESLDALAEMSCDMDARRPREVDDFQADEDDEWARRHASLLEIGCDEALKRRAADVEESLAKLTEARDGLMGFSFLRDHYSAAGGEGPGGFDYQTAWALKRRLEDLERNRPEAINTSTDHEGVLRDHEEWMCRFPSEWTRDPTDKVAAAARDSADNALSDLKEEIAVLSGDAESGGTGKHARLSELRRVAAAGAAAGVGGRGHREFLRRAELREEAAKKLGGRTADDLSLESIRTEMALNGFRSLRVRVLALREASEVELDINPLCASCLNRESYREKCRARDELALCERELAAYPDGEEERLVEQKESVHILLDVARELAAGSAEHAREAERWMAAEEAFAAMRETADELRAAEGEAVGRLDGAREEIEAARRLRVSAREYLCSAAEKRAICVAARWAIDARDVRTALWQQAAAWSKKLAAVDADIREADRERNRLRAFADTRAGWERRREDVRALRAWRAERAELDYRIRNAELAARLARARIEEAELTRLEGIQGQMRELERLSHVLAHRRWAALEDDRERLMTESNVLAAKAAVAEERLDRMRRKGERESSLRDCHAELLARHSKLKRLLEAFVGGGESPDPHGGFKSWLYRTRVAPFLEREVNAFVQEIDDFRIRVAVRKADDLTFRIEDRGSSPSLDHASGYQKFVLSLAMRIALGRIGAAGHNLKTLFVDEGFTAFDSSNMKKAKTVLDALMRLGGYRSVLLVSHLDMVREAADFVVQVERRPRDPVSRIRFGARD